MRKMEVGQLLHLNGLDMGEFMSWVDNSSIKITEEGEINFLRYEVERWICKNKGDNSILVLNNEIIKF